MFFEALNITNSFLNFLVSHFILKYWMSVYCFISVLLRSLCLFSVVLFCSYCVLYLCTWFSVLLDIVLKKIPWGKYYFSRMIISYFKEDTGYSFALPGTQHTRDSKITSIVFQDLRSFWTFLMTRSLAATHQGLLSFGISWLRFPFTSPCLYISSL